MKLGKKDVGYVVNIEWIDAGVQKAIYLGKDFDVFRSGVGPKEFRLVENDDIENHRFFGIEERKLFSIDAWSQVKQICHKAL